MSDSISKTPTDTLNSFKAADRFFKASHDTIGNLEGLFMPTPSPTQSLLMTHPLKDHHFKPGLVPQYQSDWILGIVLLWVTIIAWVRYFYSKRLVMIIYAPFSKRFQNQLTREGNIFSERIALAMVFSYILSFSLLFYKVYDIWIRDRINLNLSGISVFGIICILLLLYWSFKVALMVLLSSVFKTKLTTQLYLMNILVINIIGSLTMIPLLIPAIYMKSPFMLQIALIMTALIFIFRLWKGFLSGLTLTKFSYIFLFVYLCTLEILP
ncbi:MAG: DUF4271 domain-containing protein, partial [Bacteroidota bacterium]